MARRVVGLDLDHRSTRSLFLWVGLLGPPLVWGAHVVLGDGMFELGCTRAFGTKDILGIPLLTASIIETAIMASLTLLTGFLAFLAFRRLRKETDGTSHNRAMAMAVFGSVQGVFYFLIIALQFLPPLLLRACEVPL